MRTSTFSRLLGRTLAVTGMALLLTAFTARDAQAHCDTMDGPVVTAARHALERDSLSHVLIWVRAQDEAEVGEAFRQARAVRRLGGDASALADRYFFETVVRLHRAGEGEPYTGLKPAGTPLGAAVPAADRALAAGDVAALEALLVDAVRHGLHERFERAESAKAFRAGDVEGGRRFVAAYVPLMHYVEQLHELATGAGDAHGADRPVQGTHPTPAPAPAHHDRQ